MSHIVGLRAAGALALAGVLIVVPAAVASAHVHLEPSSTAAEGSAQLSFKVPTESEKASTTKLSITLPQSSPFVNVAVQAMPGWSAKVETAALPSPVTVEGTELTKAPSTVTWTANSTADGVPPEQYQYFTLTVGPLPKAGTALQLPATQTYSDGTVVKWNQETPAGGDEPEHPVPELTTTAAAAGAHEHGDDDGDGDDDAVMAAAPASSTTAGTQAAAGSDSTARWLGGIGLALGVIAVAVAGASAARGRRPVQPKA